MGDVLEFRVSAKPTSFGPGKLLAFSGIQRFFMAKSAFFFERDMASAQNLNAVSQRYLFASRNNLAYIGMIISETYLDDDAALRHTKTLIDKCVADGDSEPIGMCYLELDRLKKDSAIADYCTRSLHDALMENFPASREAQWLSDEKCDASDAKIVYFKGKVE